MSYFPNAFQKMLVATNATTPFPSTVGATTAILAGQVAVVDASTNVTINTALAPVYGTGPGQFTQVYLAQGSFHTSDKIGPFHGGYKETVKSKGINPKYVSSFYVTAPAPAVNNVLEVCQVNCGLECDTMYDLRLDIKGSPALRFLNHNMYQILSGFTGCCTYSGASTTPDKVDPNVVLLQWADQINGLFDANGLPVVGGNSSIPFLSQFVNAKVFNKTALATTATGVALSSTITVVSAGAGLTAIQAGNKVKVNGYTAYVGSTYVPASTTVPLVNPNGSPFIIPANIAALTPVKFYREITTATYVPLTGASAITVDSCIDIIGAYVDTVFGDCSFDPKDNFEIEPILLYASLAAYSNNSNDLNGNPCVVSCFTVNTLQIAQQGKGYGETLIRELILAKRYQQEPWYDDARLREVTGDTVLGSSNAGGPEIIRANSYHVYYLLHTVPRKYNPSGTFDQDQYLIKVVTRTRNPQFEVWWNTFLTSAQAGVNLAVVL